MLRKSSKEDERSWTKDDTNLLTVTDVGNVSKRKKYGWQRSQLALGTGTGIKRIGYI